MLVSHASSGPDSYSEWNPLARKAMPQPPPSTLSPPPLLAEPDATATANGNGIGRSASPNKNHRMNLFEGFRNTLRSRPKPDVKEVSAEEKGITRRWSEVGTTHGVRRQKMVTKRMGRLDLDKAQRPQVDGAKSGCKFTESQLI